ncbi:MAG TPA: HEAT repeat domain-containing protein, partial [Gemmatimonadaceae bacterium]|nr:HEAT repeat domain-containing protein [Gemmatimonadaceae bacterium]
MQFRRLAATLALLLACASAQAQRVPSGATAGDVALYARLLAMTDTRQLDTAIVDRALASHWPALRAAAALAVGQIGAERSLTGAARLRGLLTASQPVVAATAAYALGLLRDSGSVSGLAASVDRSGAVALEAAWALGEIGAPARIELTRQLQRNHPADVAIQLLLAVAKLRPLPLAQVRPYLRNTHPPVVWAAAYAITRTRAAGGVRDLIDLTDSPVAHTAVAGGNGK